MEWASKSERTGEASGWVGIQLVFKGKLEFESER